jgi:DNA-binding NarL/FixJ family response regulator
VALVRVLLAEDHAALLLEIRAHLCREFDIVGAVADGVQAVDAVRLLDPDVLVIDISMPVMDGLEAAKILQDAHCRTKIVILTISEQAEYISAAFAVGASAYVTKRRLSTELIPAIQEVLQGRTFLSASLRV